MTRDSSQRRGDRHSPRPPQRRYPDWTLLLLMLAPGVAMAAQSPAAALQNAIPRQRDLALEAPALSRTRPALSAYEHLAAVSPQAPQPGRGPLPASADAEIVVLEVRIGQHTLADGITAYHDGENTFLPLGEIARLLTLAITAQPATGTAQGYVLEESRSFSLHTQQARVTIDGRSQEFDPALVRVDSEDVYVAVSLLEKWLPVNFVVNLSGLLLEVEPRERLPLQERLDRERAAQQLDSGRTGSQEEPDYPRQDLPYRLLGVPFIDQTLGVGYQAGNGSQQTSGTYTAYLTGDLARMESALYVSSSRDNPSPDVRFTLGRHDPDAGLLGPLRASSVMVGTGVPGMNVTNVSVNSRLSKGLGVMLSNRPLNKPTSFDRHTLQGDLPPGWDVELYFNGALVSFQSSRPDGRYSFEDQPLVYGQNEFRLVFHGPLGQQRVEKQIFLLEGSGTPPGTFYYAFAHHQDSSNRMRSVAQFELGLSKNMTATGGFVLLPPHSATRFGIPLVSTSEAAVLGDTGNIASTDSFGNIGLVDNNADNIGTADGAGNNQRLYSNLGLRGFWSSYVFSSDFVRSPAGGLLNESGIKTRVGSVAVSYSRTTLNDFSSDVFLPAEDPLRTRDRLRVDGAIEAGGMPRLPVTMELLRDRFASGNTNLALTGRVAAYVRRTALSNQLTWQSSQGQPTAMGAVQISRRFGDIGLSGQVGYTLRPQARAETLILSGDKHLGGGYLLNLGVARSVSSGEMLYSAGLNKSLGRYGFGLSSRYTSSGNLAVGLQLFIGMGREPRQGAWRADALPKADGGAASVRVFEDMNGNGTLDAGEAPIGNVAINVNGSRMPTRTDAAGIAWLDRLPVRQGVDIAVDTATLEDPYWMPRVKGVRLVPRPGHVAQVDFPIILTSEIDGTVQLVSKGVKRGTGNVEIQLLAADSGAIVSSIKTSSDGYYVIPSVAQGDYLLRVSPEQLSRLGLADPGVRPVTVAPDGKFIDGMDFLLHGAADKPGVSPDQPETTGHEEK